MTSSYRNGPPIFEQKHEKNQDLGHRLWGSLLALLSPRIWSRFNHGRSAQPLPQSRIVRFLPLLFIIIWVFTLWWGERVVFRYSIERCSWDHWENWVSNLPTKIVRPAFEGEQCC